MKFFSFILLLCFLGCHSPNTNAQVLTPQNEDKAPDMSKVNTYIDVFFKKYKDEGASTAIDYIFSSNILLTDKSQLDDLKNKLDSTRKIIGKYYGNSLIIKKNVSSDLVLLTYLVKHEKQPIRFSFIFYKANENWMLYKFQYDDQVISELEDSGKIYFIK